MRHALLVVALALLNAAPVGAQDWGNDDGFGDGDPPAQGDGFGADDPSAQGDGFGGDGFGGDGFAPPPPPPAVDVPPPPGDHRLTLTGFARRDEAVWTERFDDPAARPYAKLRHSLDLSLEYGFKRALKAVLAGHLEHDLAYTLADGYDPEQVAAYERRVLNGEQYLRASLGSVDVTVGRQIVAWGEGDALSVLDVVNPRDNREPGLADLDDLRLAVLATRVSWFTGAHRVELMGIHEAYFGEFAPPLADYSPFRALVAGDPLAAAVFGGKRVRFAHAPARWSLDGQMALARWVYKGPGLDLGLYAASVLDRTGVVVLPAVVGPWLTADVIGLRLDHPRYTLAGTSGATALGAWLIKWELASEIHKAFNAGDPAAGPIPELRVDRGTTLQAMTSVGYTGVTDLQLFVEVQKGFVLDGPSDLLLPVEAPIAAVRATYSLLRERLQLSAAATSIGWTAERGWLVRGQAQYDVGDGFSVSAGYISYQPGRSATDFGPFYGFDKHDRLFTQVRWDFLVPVLR